MPSAGLSRSGFAQVEDRETVRTSDSQPGAKAAELAVFLACHFGGADARTIGEYLEPDARLRQADQHVHNNVSNLRHVMGRAAGFRRTAYLPRDDGRYRLDPATVDINLWTARDLVSGAGRDTDPAAREDLLRHACSLYFEPLAPIATTTGSKPTVEQVLAPTLERGGKIDAFKPRERR